MKLTGAQIFVETLAEQGVELLFGYPGGTVLNLFDALYESAGRVKWVLTADECGAAHAADGLRPRYRTHRRGAGPPAAPAPPTW